MNNTRNLEEIKYSKKNVNKAVAKYEIIDLGNAIKNAILPSYWNDFGTYSSEPLGILPKGTTHMFMLVLSFRSR